MKKNFSKALALLLTLMMAFSMTVPAFAATIVSNNQDTSVLSLSSTGNTVSYTAITVKGDPDNTGTGFEDVTTYSYYIMLPQGSTSLSSVAIDAVYPNTYTFRLDGIQQKYIANEDGTRTTNMSVDLTTSHVIAVYSGRNAYRTFILAGGVDGATLPNVTMRINVQNAYAWLKDGNTLDRTSSAGLAYLKDHTGITVSAEGVASDMVPVTLTGLPAGSTAMDALYYICNGVNDGSGVEVSWNGRDISTNGLGIDLDGTGRDSKGQYTYIAAMGDKTSNAWLGEFSTTSTSGWLYLDYQNGNYNMPGYGASQYNLVGGEAFVWLFTNAYGDFDILG